MSETFNLHRNIVEYIKFNRHARHLDEFNRALELSKRGAAQPTSKAAREAEQLVPPVQAFDPVATPEPELELETA